MSKRYELNLNHLEIFDSVILQGSVSRGAERLMISQPSASKQLNLLEREAGVCLLERSGRGIRATTAGAMLARYARRIFEAKTDADRAIAEFHGVERGELRV